MMLNVPPSRNPYANTMCIESLLPNVLPHEGHLRERLEMRSLTQSWQKT